MANRLAGQHAKFSRGRALYYSSGEEDQRARAVRLMAEVLADAPRAGFSEKAVTQSEDVPDEVRRYPLLTKQGHWRRARVVLRTRRRIVRRGLTVARIASGASRR